MNRRGFLRALGLGAVGAAVAPAKILNALAEPALDNTSIYLIGWSPDAVYAFAPNMDWRYCVRIANIDVSKLAAAGPELTEVVRRFNDRRAT